VFKEGGRQERHKRQAAGRTPRPRRRIDKRKEEMRRQRHKRQEVG